METKIATPVAAALLLFTLGGTACGNRQSRVVNEEPAGGAVRTLSVVRMNDPNATAQLLSGFYSVENNSWRWTSGSFSVLLHPPAGASQQGATLTLAFNIPESVIQQLKEINLSAAIDGKPVGSAGYQKSGSYLYHADVAPSMLTPESVKVDFTLDKTYHPEVDKRVLGVVVTSAGLTSK